MGERNYKVNKTKEKALIDKILKISERLYKILNIKLSKAEYVKYKNRLILSGLNNKVTVEQFIGMKILASIIAGTYFLLVFACNPNMLNFLLLVFGNVMCYFILDSLLSIKINKRKQEIEREIPNILNSLAIVTDSGLGLMEAIKMVCEVKKGTLVDELKKVVEEINMGILQSEALLHFSDRCEVNEITVFVFTLIQSFEKGASGVTLALNEQAKEVWENRKNKSKELGQKATIKLFISMMIFVFPCLLIFILGPAIIEIFKMLNK
jgi:tight adherence protein C